MSLLCHSSFTFLVYCCFFCFSTLLFSWQVFTDSSTTHQVSSSFTSLDPSMPVTPGSQPLPPCFQGTTHHGFHPKYHIKFHQNHCWMICHPPCPKNYPILLHPFVHDLDLLDVHSSLLVQLVVVLRGRKQAPVSINFEAHQTPITTQHPITWPTLSQPFITPFSISVQPKRNFYDGTTDWSTWASRRFNFS